MNKRKMNEKQIALIKDLACDFADFVEKTESGLKTTQNNYGKYGAMLSRLANGNKQYAQIYALAMIEAGANVQGVNDALKCFF